jgi:uncharacterized protein (DUF2062 family)
VITYGLSGSVAVHGFWPHIRPRYATDTHSSITHMLNSLDLVYAYLDPMSGSVILQAVIAGALGALLTFKRVGFAMREAWSRLVKRIKG